MTLSPLDPLPSRRSLEDLWGQFGAEVASRKGSMPALDKWLEGVFKRNPKFGKRDRRDIRDAFFAVFRYLEPLTWLAQGRHPLLHTESNKEQDVPVPKDIVSQALSLKWSTLADLWNEIPQIENELLRHGFPRFYGEDLASRAQLSQWCQARRSEFVRAQTVPSPLWIRVNVLKTTPQRVVDALRADAPNFQVLQENGTALQVAVDKSLYHTQAFVDGGFEIQDYASQQIGRALGALAPNSVWDVCAGAGGKSLQISTLMKGTGAVFCTDIRQHALEECQRRAARHGLTNIRTQVWDGIHAPELPRSLRPQGGFDVVLVDAPCSSSGTWRRNPEARYRNSPEILAEFQSIQSRLVGIAATRVRSGGALVYSTCSWLPQENETVITRFLEERAAAGDLWTCAQMGMEGLPDADSDAMFVAVLKKV